METDSGPVYRRQFWAKSDRNDSARIHLLEHHLADVGACFEALLEQPLIRQRLAASGGLADLDASAIARLAVFAALHDIGKVNIGFQTRIWRDGDYPPGRRPSLAGHIVDLQPVLNGNDGDTNRRFFDALGWWDAAAQSWDDAGGETVCGLLIAALSHHGKPLQLDGKRNPHPQLWRAYGGLDPVAAVRRIGELARRWFPAAFAPGAPPLPSAPAFQHHFLGLGNLADWIGSNERWFPYTSAPDDDYINAARRQAHTAIDEIGLNLTQQRQAFPAAPPSFASLFGSDDNPFRPNAIQKAAQATPPDAPLVIIESETGSGKTEAALSRFAEMYRAGLVDGLYFALPTRAAAKQIHGRVIRFIDRMFPAETAPEPVLAIPGYLQAGDITGRHMHDYQVWWDDHAADGPRWAAESPKRFLAAQIAVGTIDQALLGALAVKNAHLRAASLARNLLVVDEVHASDIYMSVVLEELLAAHHAAGGYALLMSATLGSDARQRWLRPGRRPDAGLSLNDAIAVPYPAISVRRRAGDDSPSEKDTTAAGENGQDKDVAIAAVPEMADFAAVARRALDAADAGAKVLVIRNTVGHAVNTQAALQELAGPGDAARLFAVNGVPTLHHGRFAAGDRKLLDDAVEQRLGRGESRRAGGVVVVGTQTLEQSLDIDADLLLTDLCPADVLLQRIGRLHRHRENRRPEGYAQPQCRVLTPPDGDLSPLLRQRADANGLGPHGYVYRSLQMLEATRRLIDAHPQWRIPAMNRELVERATHPEALAAITDELGEEWRQHANDVAGGHIADAQIARNSLIRRDKAFYPELENRETLFPGDDEHIRTRLGDDRLEVTLDPPPPSPLAPSPYPSQFIDKLAIPVRWLDKTKVSETAQPTLFGSDFEFSVGDRKFYYDRLGLRRV